MKILMDSDVEATIEFMQTNVPADKLTSVATAVERLAHILWGRYEASEVQPLSLTSGRGLHTQLDASE